MWIKTANKDILVNSDYIKRIRIVNSSPDDILKDVIAETLDKYNTYYVLYKGTEDVPNGHIAFLKGTQKILNLKD